MDTPLSTVREELKSTAEKSQAKALSLCLPLSLSLALSYSDTQAYIHSPSLVLSQSWVHREKKTAESPSHLFTHRIHFVFSPSCYCSFQSYMYDLYHVTIAQIYRFALMKHLDPQKKDTWVLFPFNQPQMPSTHAYMCLWGWDIVQTTKQAHGFPLNRVLVCVYVCVCIRVCPVVSPVCAVAPHPPLIMSPPQISLSLFLSLATNWSGQL